MDWKGIAFDGSHGTHTSLTGERHFVNPAGPGWASRGNWKTRAPRPKMANDTARCRRLGEFEGLYQHRNQSVIAASIGGTRVLESPGWIDYGTTPVFVRTLNVAEAKQPLLAARGAGQQ